MKTAMLSTMLLVSLLLGAALASSDPPASSNVAPVDLSALELSDDLLAMFEEELESGTLALGPESRAYFAALPSHAQDLLETAIEEGMITRAEHLAGLLSLDLDANEFELLLTDNCILCHTDTDWHEEETLMQMEAAGEFGESHLSLVDFLSGKHFRRGLSCAGCHGGDPAALEMTDDIYERWPEYSERREDRTWIPEFCGRCHSDPSFMRAFNPAMATDQVAKYRTSRHGTLLLEEGDSAVAQCVSCHGVHGIRGPQSRQSMVHPQAIPATCGACHADAALMAGRIRSDGSNMPTDQLENYRQSVHGVALLERGDLGAPACNDCHGNHAAMPPEVAHVSQVCRSCHTLNGSLFDGSSHKKAFQARQWPECGQCHGDHEITKTSDAMLGTEPGELCYDCHAQYAQTNDQCIETADHFRGVLTDLVASEEHLLEKLEWMHENGLDAEVVEAAEGDLHDTIRTARSAIHSFDKSDFDATVQAGIDAVARAELSIVDAEGEFGFRRRGLLASIAFMMFLAVVLALRIRQVDRDRSRGKP